MRTFKQFMSDFKKNIGYAKTGLCINIHDPWFKKDVEEQLNKRNIKYVTGFEPYDKFYEYAIWGGKQEDINDFVKWFKSAGDWKYYVTKHAIFKTRITCLVL